MRFVELRSVMSSYAANGTDSVTVLARCRLHLKFAVFIDFT